MEINKETLLKIYDKSLDGSQYLLLQLLGTQVDIKSILSNTKIKGTVLMLEKKKLVEKIANNIYQLTVQGKKIFQEIGVLKSPDIKEIDNSEITKIYAKIEHKIQEITGKKQILNPSGKYLKPSLEVFRTRLLQFFQKFNITDIECVEKTLLLYIEKVCKNQIKYPVALVYFIWNEKNKVEQSELLEWMEQVNEIQDYDGTNI